MKTLLGKMKTAAAVLRERGGLAFGVELYANLLPRKAAAAFRGRDHWWLGRLVELSGNVVRIDRCRFHVAGAAISTPVKTRFVFDTYELPERAALREFLEVDLPVVEFGGGIGVVSCLTNRRLRRPERHIVVEANPDLIAVIEKNRVHNDCRFTVVNSALAYGRERIDFYRGDNFLANSLLVATEEKVSVGVTTLQQVLDQYGFETVNLLCDVEGEEVELVRHELAQIQARVKVFMLELHPSIAGEAAIAGLITDLQTAGFKAVNHHPTVRVFRNERLN